MDELLTSLLLTLTAALLFGAFLLFIVVESAALLIGLGLTANEALKRAGIAPGRPRS